MNELPELNSQRAKIIKQINGWKLTEPSWCMTKATSSNPSMFVTLSGYCVWDENDNLIADFKDKNLAELFLELTQND